MHCSPFYLHFLGFLYRSFGYGIFRFLIGLICREFLEQDFRFVGVFDICLYWYWYSIKIEFNWRGIFGIIIMYSHYYYYYLKYYYLICWNIYCFIVIIINFIISLRYILFSFVGILELIYCGRIIHY